MTSFQSWRSFWDFSRLVTNNSGYQANCFSFVDALKATAVNRVLRIDAGSLLCRAQKGHTEVEDEEASTIFDTPLPAERMLPDSRYVTEGRANRKGVAYLYVSDSLHTAISEVRPWINSYVTVAKMRVRRDLKTINLTSSQKSVRLCFDEPEPTVRAEIVWGHIDDAFSSPVAREDDTRNYRPTQIIAEVLCEEGYDAVAFRSSVSAGTNFVLFDPGLAEIVERHLVRIKSVNVEYEWA